MRLLQAVVAGRRHLAYLWGQEEEEALWRLDIKTGKSEGLTDLDLDELAWSPRGDDLLPVSEGDLYFLPLGGKPRRLTETEEEETQPSSVGRRAAEEVEPGLVPVQALDRDGVSGPGNPGEIAVLVAGAHPDRLPSRGADDSCTPLLTETRPTWINLGNDLRFLGDGDDGRFIWGSEGDGWRRLYLHDRNGKLVRPITPEGWGIASLEEVVDGGAGRSTGPGWTGFFERTLASSRTASE